MFHLQAALGFCDTRPTPSPFFFFIGHAELILRAHQTLDPLHGRIFSTEVAELVCLATSCLGPSRTQLSSTPFLFLDFCSSVGAVAATAAAFDVH